MEHEKRKPFQANPYEKKFMKIIFISAAIPFCVLMAIFYAMFHNLIYEYLNLSLLKNFIRQFTILAIIAFMYYFIFVGLIAYHYAHRMFGALPRVLREFDELLQGGRKRSIKLRDKDFGKELVEKINVLIEKLP